MSGREAHHPAGSGFSFGNHKAFVMHIHAGQNCIFAQRRLACWRFQSGEVVFKDESGFVLRIGEAAGARVSGTQITSRVILRTIGCWERLNRALPGTLGSMWRNQYPFVGERVKTAVRLLVELQFSVSPYSCGLKT